MLRKNLTKRMEESGGKVRFKRWRAMSWGSRISLVVLALIVLCAIFAPVIAPHDPIEIFTARQAPSSEFLFGTDEKGRDTECLPVANRSDGGADGIAIENGRWIIYQHP